MKRFQPPTSKTPQRISQMKKPEENRFTSELDNLPTSHTQNSPTGGPLVPYDREDDRLPKAEQGRFSLGEQKSTIENYRQSSHGLVNWSDLDMNVQEKTNCGGEERTSQFRPQILTGPFKSQEAAIKAPDMPVLREIRRIPVLSTLPADVSARSERETESFRCVEDPARWSRSKTSHIWKTPSSFSGGETQPRYTAHRYSPYHYPSESSHYGMLQSSKMSCFNGDAVGKTFSSQAPVGEYLRDHQGKALVTAFLSSLARMAADDESVTDPVSPSNVSLLCVHRAVPEPPAPLLSSESDASSPSSGPDWASGSTVREADSVTHITDSNSWSSIQTKSDVSSKETSLNLPKADCGTDLVCDVYPPSDHDELQLTSAVKQKGGLTTSTEANDLSGKYDSPQVPHQRNEKSLTVDSCKQRRTNEETKAENIQLHAASAIFRPSVLMRSEQQEECIGEESSQISNPLKSHMFFLGPVHQQEPKESQLFSMGDSMDIIKDTSEHLPIFSMDKSHEFLEGDNIFTGRNNESLHKAPNSARLSVQDLFTSEDNEVNLIKGKSIQPSEIFITSETESRRHLFFEHGEQLPSVDIDVTTITEKKSVNTPDSHNSAEVIHRRCSSRQDADHSSSRRAGVTTTTKMKPTIKTQEPFYRSEVPTLSHPAVTENSEPVLSLAEEQTTTQKEVLANELSDHAEPRRSVSNDFAGVCCAFGEVSTEDEVFARNKEETRIALSGYLDLNRQSDPVCSSSGASEQLSLSSKILMKETKTSMTNHTEKSTQVDLKMPSSGNRWGMPTRMNSYNTSRSFVDESPLNPVKYEIKKLNDACNQTLIYDQLTRQRSKRNKNFIRFSNLHQICSEKNKSIISKEGERTTVSSESREETISDGHKLSADGRQGSIRSAGDNRSKKTIAGVYNLEHETRSTPRVQSLRSTANLGYKHSFASKSSSVIERCQTRADSALDSSAGGFNTRRINSPLRAVTAASDTAQSLFNRSLSDVLQGVYPAPSYFSDPTDLLQSISSQSIAHILKDVYPSIPYFSDSALEQLRVLTESERDNSPSIVCAPKRCSSDITEPRDRLSFLGEGAKITETKVKDSDGNRNDDFLHVSQRSARDIHSGSIQAAESFLADTVSELGFSTSDYSQTSRLTDSFSHASDKTSRLTDSYSFESDQTSRLTDSYSCESDQTSRLTDSVSSASDAERDGDLSPTSSGSAKSMSQRLTIRGLQVGVLHNDPLNTQTSCHQHTDMLTSDAALNTYFCPDQSANDQACSSRGEFIAVPGVHEHGSAEDTKSYSSTGYVVTHGKSGDTKTHNSTGYTVTALPNDSIKAVLGHNSCAGLDKSASLCSESPGSSVVFTNHREHLAETSHATSDIRQRMSTHGDEWTHIEHSDKHNTEIKNELKEKISETWMTSRASLSSSGDCIYYGDSSRTSGAPPDNSHLSAGCLDFSGPWAAHMTQPLENVSVHTQEKNRPFGDGRERNASFKNHIHAEEANSVFSASISESCPQKTSGDKNSSWTQIRQLETDMPVKNISRTTSDAEIANEFITLLALDKVINDAEMSFHQLFENSEENVTSKQMSSELLSSSILKIADDLQRNVLCQAENRSASESTMFCLKNLKEDSMKLLDFTETKNASETSSVSNLCSNVQESPTCFQIRIPKASVQTLSEESMEKMNTIILRASRQLHELKVALHDRRLEGIFTSLVVEICDALTPACSKDLSKTEPQRILQVQETFQECQAVKDGGLLSCKSSACNASCTEGDETKDVDCFLSCMSQDESALKAKDSNRGTILQFQTSLKKDNCDEQELKKSDLNSAPSQNHEFSSHRLEHRQMGNARILPQTFVGETLSSATCTLPSLYNFNRSSRSLSEANEASATSLTTVLPEPENTETNEPPLPARLSKSTVASINKDEALKIIESYSTIGFCIREVLEKADPDLHQVLWNRVHESEQRFNRAQDAQSPLQFLSAKNGQNCAGSGGTERTYSSSCYGSICSEMAKRLPLQQPEENRFPSAQDGEHLSITDNITQGDVLDNTLDKFSVQMGNIRGKVNHMLNLIRGYNSSSAEEERNVETTRKEALTSRKSAIHSASGEEKNISKETNKKETTKEMYRAEHQEKESKQNIPDVSERQFAPEGLMPDRFMSVCLLECDPWQDAASQDYIPISTFQVQHSQPLIHCSSVRRAVWPKITFTKNTQPEGKLSLTNDRIRFIVWKWRRWASNELSRRSRKHHTSRERQAAPRLSSMPHPPEDSTSPLSVTFEDEDNTAAPEGNTAAPEGKTPAPEGNTAAPEGNTAAPEDNTAAPERNTAAPEGNTAASKKDRTNARRSGMHTPSDKTQRTKEEGEPSVKTKKIKDNRKQSDELTLTTNKHPDDPRKAKTRAEASLTTSKHHDRPRKAQTPETKDGASSHHSSSTDRDRVLSETLDLTAQKANPQTAIFDLSKSPGIIKFGDCVIDDLTKHPLNKHRAYMNRCSPSQPQHKIGPDTLFQRKQRITKDNIQSSVKPRKTSKHRVPSCSCRTRQYRDRYYVDINSQMLQPSDCSNETLTRRTSSPDNISGNVYTHSMITRIMPSSDSQVFSLPSGSTDLLSKNVQFMQTNLLKGRRMHVSDQEQSTANIEHKEERKGFFKQMVKKLCLWLQSSPTVPPVDFQGRGPATVSEMKQSSYADIFHNDTASSEGTGKRSRSNTRELLTPQQTQYLHAHLFRPLMYSPSCSIPGHTEASNSGSSTAPSHFRRIYRGSVSPPFPLQKSASDPAPRQNPRYRPRQKKDSFLLKSQISQESFGFQPSGIFSKAPHRCLNRSASNTSKEENQEMWDSGHKNSSPVPLNLRDKTSAVTPGESSGHISISQTLNALDSASTMQGITCVFSNSHNASPSLPISQQQAMDKWKWDVTRDSKIGCDTMDLLPCFEETFGKEVLMNKFLQECINCQKDNVQQTGAPTMSARNSTSVQNLVRQGHKAKDNLKESASRMKHEHWLSSSSNQPKATKTLKRLSSSPKPLEHVGSEAMKSSKDQESKIRQGHSSLPETRERSFQSHSPSNENPNTSSQSQQKYSTLDGWKKQLTSIGQTNTFYLGNVSEEGAKEFYSFPDELPLAAIKDEMFFKQYQPDFRRHVRNDVSVTSSSQRKNDTQMEYFNINETQKSSSRMSVKSMKSAKALGTCIFKTSVASVIENPETSQLKDKTHKNKRTVTRNNSTASSGWDDSTNINDNTPVCYDCQPHLEISLLPHLSVNGKNEGGNKQMSCTLDEASAVYFSMCAVDKILDPATGQSVFKVTGTGSNANCTKAVDRSKSSKEYFECVEREKARRRRLINCKSTPTQIQEQELSPTSGYSSSASSPASHPDCAALTVRQQGSSAGRRRLLELASESQATSPSSSKTIKDQFQNARSEASAFAQNNRSCKKTLILHSVTPVRDNTCLNENLKESNSPNTSKVSVKVFGRYPLHCERENSAVSSSLSTEKKTLTRIEHEARTSRNVVRPVTRPERFAYKLLILDSDSSATQLVGSSRKSNNSSPQKTANEKISVAQRIAFFNQLIDSHNKAQPRFFTRRQLLVNDTSHLVNDTTEEVPKATHNMHLSYPDSSFLPEAFSEDESSRRKPDDQRMSGLSLGINQKYGPVETGQSDKIGTNGELSSQSVNSLEKTVLLAGQQTKPSNLQDKQLFCSELLVKPLKKRLHPVQKLPSVSQSGDDTFQLSPSLENNDDPPFLAGLRTDQRPLVSPVSLCTSPPVLPNNSNSSSSSMKSCAVEDTGLLSSRAQTDQESQVSHASRVIADSKISSFWTVMLPGCTDGNDGQLFIPSPSSSHPNNGNADDGQQGDPACTPPAAKIQNLHVISNRCVYAKDSALQQHPDSKTESLLKPLQNDNARPPAWRHKSDINFNQCVNEVMESRNLNSDSDSESSSLSPFLSDRNEGTSTLAVRHKRLRKKQTNFPTMDERQNNNFINICTGKNSSVQDSSPWSMCTDTPEAQSRVDSRKHHLPSSSPQDKCTRQTTVSVSTNFSTDERSPKNISNNKGTISLSSDKHRYPSRPPSRTICQTLQRVDQRRPSLHRTPDQIIDQSEGQWQVGLWETQDNHFYEYLVRPSGNLYGQVEPTARTYTALKQLQGSCAEFSEDVLTCTGVGIHSSDLPNITTLSCSLGHVYREESRDTSSSSQMSIPSSRPRSKGSPSLWTYFTQEENRNKSCHSSSSSEMVSAGDSTSSDGAQSAYSSCLSCNIFQPQATCLSIDHNSGDELKGRTLSKDGQCPMNQYVAALTDQSNRLIASQCTSDTDCVLKENIRRTIHEYLKRFVLLSSSTPELKTPILERQISPESKQFLDHCIQATAQQCIQEIANHAHKITVSERMRQVSEGNPTSERGANSLLSANTFHRDRMMFSDQRDTILEGTMQRISCQHVKEIIDQVRRAISPESKAHSDGSDVYLEAGPNSWTVDNPVPPETMVISKRIHRGPKKNHRLAPSCMTDQANDTAASKNTNMSSASRNHSFQRHAKGYSTSIQEKTSNVDRSETRDFLQYRSKTSDGLLSGQGQVRSNDGTRGECKPDPRCLQSKKAVLKESHVSFSVDGRMNLLRPSQDKTTTEKERTQSRSLVPPSSPRFKDTCKIPCIVSKHGRRGEESLLEKENNSDHRRNNSEAKQRYRKSAGVDRCSTVEIRGPVPVSSFKMQPAESKSPDVLDSERYYDPTDDNERINVEKDSQRNYLFTCLPKPQTQNLSSTTQNPMLSVETVREAPETVPERARCTMTKQTASASRGTLEKMRVNTTRSTNFVRRNLKPAEMLQQHQAPEESMGRDGDPDLKCPVPKERSPILSFSANSPEYFPESRRTSSERVRRRRAHANSILASTSKTQTNMFSSVACTEHEQSSRLTGNPVSPAKKPTNVETPGYCLEEPVFRSAHCPPRNELPSSDAGDRKTTLVPSVSFELGQTSVIPDAVSGSSSENNTALFKQRNTNAGMPSEDSQHAAPRSIINSTNRENRKVSPKIEIKLPPFGSSSNLRAAPNENRGLSITTNENNKDEQKHRRRSAPHITEDDIFPACALRGKRGDPQEKLEIIPNACNSGSFHQTSVTDLVFQNNDDDSTQQISYDTKCGKCNRRMTYQGEDCRTATMGQPQGYQVDAVMSPAIHVPSVKRKSPQRTTIVQKNGTTITVEGMKVVYSGSKQPGSNLTAKSTGGHQLKLDALIEPSISTSSHSNEPGFRCGAAAAGGVYKPSAPDRCASSSASVVIECEQGGPGGVVRTSASFTNTSKGKRLNTSEQNVLARITHARVLLTSQEKLLTLNRKIGEILRQTLVAIRDEICKEEARWKASERQKEIKKARKRRLIEEYKRAAQSAMAGALQSLDDEFFSEEDEMVTTTSPPKTTPKKCTVVTCQIQGCTCSQEAARVDQRINKSLTAPRRFYRGNSELRFPRNQCRPARNDSEDTFYSTSIYSWSPYSRQNRGGHSSPNLFCHKGRRKPCSKGHPLKPNLCCLQREANRWSGCDCLDSKRRHENFNRSSLTKKKKVERVQTLFAPCSGSSTMSLKSEVRGGYDGQQKVSNQTTQPANARCWLPVSPEVGPGQRLKGKNNNPCPANALLHIHDSFFSDLKHLAKKTAKDGVKNRQRSLCSGCRGKNPDARYLLTQRDLTRIVAAVSMTAAQKGITNHWKCLSSSMLRSASDYGSNVSVIKNTVSSCRNSSAKCGHRKQTRPASRHTCLTDQTTKGKAPRCVSPSCCDSDEFLTGRSASTDVKSCTAQYSVICEHSTCTTSSFTEVRTVHRTFSYDAVCPCVKSSSLSVSIISSQTSQRQPYPGHDCCRHACHGKAQPYSYRSACGSGASPGLVSSKQDVETREFHAPCRSELNSAETSPSRTWRCCQAGHSVRKAGARCPNHGSRRYSGGVCRSRDLAGTRLDADFEQMGINRHHPAQTKNSNVCARMHADREPQKSRERASRHDHNVWHVDADQKEQQRAFSAFRKRLIAMVNENMTGERCCYHAAVSPDMSYGHMLMANANVLEKLRSIAVFKEADLQSLYKDAVYQHYLECRHRRHCRRQCQER